MHRLPRLLLLLMIVVASVVVSGYNRHAHANLTRHSHGHVFDLFGFEAREQVAAVGEAEHSSAAAHVSLQAPPTSGS
jgi:hypothetical protein